MVQRFVLLALVLGYLGTVLIAYFLKIDFLLFTLTIPWSMGLAAVSFLFVHISSKSEFYLDLGMLIGAILNTLIFIMLYRTFEKTRRNKKIKSER